VKGSTAPPPLVEGRLSWPDEDPDPGI